MLQDVGRVRLHGPSGGRIAGSGGDGEEKQGTQDEGSGVESIRDWVAAIAGDR